MERKSRGWWTGRVFLITLLALATLGFSTAAFGQEARAKITYALQPFFSANVSIYALEKGIVKPRGVELTIKKMFPNQTAKLLMAGALDAGQFSPSTMLIAAEKGLPLVPLASASKIKEEGNALFVLAGSPISKPLDLVGKTIGVISSTTTSAIFHKAILQHRYGLPPDKIVWLYKPMPVLVQLLGEGKIDAAITWSDFYYKLLGDKKFRLLYRLGPAWREMTGDWPIMSIVTVQKKVLDQEPQAIKELLIALRKSRDYSVKNTEAIAKEWAKEKGGDTGFLVRKARGVTFAFSLTEAEKRNLRKFSEYVFEQGLISKRIDIVPLFSDLVQQIE